MEKSRNTERAGGVPALCALTELARTYFTVMVPVMRGWMLQIYL
jgi:hypothetical protein